jgi:hypothetical protein
MYPNEDVYSEIFGAVDKEKFALIRTAIGNYLYRLETIYNNLSKIERLYWDDSPPEVINRALNRVCEFFKVCDCCPVKSECRKVRKNECGKEN